LRSLDSEIVRMCTRVALCNRIEDLQKQLKEFDDRSLEVRVEPGESAKARRSVGTAGAPCRRG